MTKRTTTIFLWVAAVSVALCLLSLIIGLAFFKPKNAITTFDSVAVKNLQFSVDIAKLKVHLNLALATDVTVKNPNPVGFKYTDSAAFLKYRGDLVGEAPIPAGEIGGGATRGMNLTLTLMADRLLSDSEFYGNVISGTLPFQTDVTLTGKVPLLRIPVVAYASCDLEIRVASRKIVKQICHNKTKL